MPYTELDHTAVVLVRVTAGSLEELFEESARAMFETMYGENTALTEEQDVTVSADTKDELLCAFLSEFLYLSEVDGMVFGNVTVTLHENICSATVRGTPFIREKHAGGTEIKGVSYSGLTIREVNNHVEVDILFDV